MVRQSAFSLIEVLVGLVLVSLSTALINKVLLESCYYFRSLAVEQSITLLLWNMQETVRFWVPSEVAERLDEWRKKFKAIDPKSDLTLHCLKVENRWIYTVQVQWGVLARSPLRFHIAVEAAAS